MRTAEELSDINSLSNFLISTLDEGVFFGKLSEFIMSHFKEYKVQIYKSFDDGSTQLIAENGRSVTDAEITTRSHGLSSYVTRTRRAYYSNAVKRDPLLANVEYEEGTQAELCIPVNAQGTILGTIHVRSSKEGKGFAEKDITEVLTILKGVELPLNNMRMYLLAKHLNRELTKKIESREKEIANRDISTNFINVIEQEIKVIGHSKIFTDIMNLIKKVSPEDFPVLIEGENGVGKKLISKKIHSLSLRKEGPCIVAHCSALHDDVLEAELFGKNDKKGLLELANGGTLILNEISELSASLQGKLLRFLLSGEIYRVGGERGLPVSVRILSTSKKSLQKEVDEGRFREDLLYRLNTVSVFVPSLRDRAEDIKILSEHFLNLGRDKEQFKVLTNKAVDALSKYNWPGNAQELRNIMERTYVLAEGKYIDDEHLPQFVREEHKVEKIAEDIFMEITLADLEKRHIVRTLDHLSGNKTKAAKALGITVKTLYNKLHSYGLVHTKI
ncbi:MAG: sigma-54-dependent Fis family transcriptional regulator [Bacteriovoracaceae bacterium]|nr:sigma-54-dependent Fis family transcriptional regulator [Bacteriovoracaceae bacterium]